MIVVFIIVLVVFGPNKLPELARGLGKLMAEFRKASADFKGAFEQEMRDLERQTMIAERKKVADAAAASAAAAPEQPATLGTAAGTETPASEGREARATEALVVAPVAEAIAREDGAAAAGVETASAGAAVENTIGNGHAGAPAPSVGEAGSVAAHDPAHDTQQPA
jgi:sec-independent protein translocase protein TatB